MTLLPAVLGRARNPDPRPLMRVLFIGNSYTRYHDLPEMVEDVAESAIEGPRIESFSVTRMGATTRRHWIHREARMRLAYGHYDAVVLQGHSMAITDAQAEETREYTARFAETAHRVGTRVVLFETWARREGHPVYRRGEAGCNPQEMLRRIDGFYGELGARLGLSVAPVGRAWIRAIERMPDATLHERDGTHPALMGTYLSSLVLYGALTDHNPRTVRWQPYPITMQDAERLQSVAAESLQLEQ
jgi:sugar phosphate isomerase/epimerase